MTFSSPLRLCALLLYLPFQTVTQKGNYADRGP